MTKAPRCLSARRVDDEMTSKNGRAGGIRTHDPSPPRRMLYQAEPQPDKLLF